MRQSRTSGSVGAGGGRPPSATRQSGPHTSTPGTTGRVQLGPGKNPAGSQGQYWTRAMRPWELFLDQRLAGMCAYCGGPPDTRDHVPSRILLDEPLPPGLPVVDACAACNQSFSLDEEYLACFLECVLCGTTVPADLGREKIKRALSKHSSLAARVNNSKRRDEEGTLIWQPENNRVRRIMSKLARGHAAYELFPQLEEPAAVEFAPLIAMSEDERAAFERGALVFGGPQLWPEIGSRAFFRACGVPPDPHPRLDGWIVVQPGRYRYAVAETGGVMVKLVLSEYLACEVVWE